jgi:polyhydroxybutyrate depolymerase
MGIRPRIPGVVAALAIAAAVGITAGVVVSASGAPTAEPQRAATAEPHRAVDVAARPHTNAPARPRIAAPARLVAGAGPLPAGWVASAHTVDVAGLVRTYLTVAPADLTGPVPVVVLMHGRDMTPDGILHASGLAGRIGPAVLVVPAGWEEFWNAGDCCGAAYRHHVDDVAFIQAAVRDVLAATPEARASRVYAVGFSNGGRLAYHLACQLPGVFAGFVAVEAVPVESCQQMRPLDVTVVAQQADPLLSIGAGQPIKRVGGFAEPSVTATVGAMRRLDGCAAAPSVTSAGAAREQTWSCTAGTQVRYVWYPGGAHDWRPATATTPGATDFVAQMLHPAAGSAHRPATS